MSESFEVFWMPHYCPICGMGFYLKDELEEHIDECSKNRIV